MIKSGTKLIQLYAIINGLIFIYYGMKTKKLILLLGGVVIVFRDTILLFRNEICQKTNTYKYDLSVRSGNKLIQLIATIFGIYLMINYLNKNNLLFILGLIIFLGDGYLAVFENPKFCIISR